MNDEIVKQMEKEREAFEQNKADALKSIFNEELDIKTNKEVNESLEELNIQTIGVNELIKERGGKHGKF